MSISRLLGFGFGFLFVILLAEIALNKYVSNRAYDQYSKLKTEVQPNVMMLNRFVSINREFSLLTSNYQYKGGIINRNRINKIIEVEFDFHISEIEAMKADSGNTKQHVNLLSNIVSSTTKLIDAGRMYTSLLVTKNDFANPEKIARSKQILEEELAPQQKELNNMLEILQYELNEELNQTQEQLARDFSNAARVIQITGFVGIFLGLLIAFWIRNSINTPILNLAEGARKISQGDYATVIPTTGNNELTKLTETFNAMTSDLGDAFTKIEEQTQKLEMTLASGKLGVFEWDIKSNALEWDSRMKSLYGHNDKTFSGAYDAWANGLHPNDKDEIEKELNDAVAGNSEFNRDFRIVWPNGEIRYIRAISMVFRNKSGEAQRMVGFNWDVSEERKAEKALKDYSAKLEEKNKELNEFSYIASHDLQEPINTMNAFSQLLLSQYADKLDPTAKEYLTYLSGAGERAKQLISDLLDYNRLGQHRTLKNIDTNLLIDAVVSDLSVQLKTAGAEIKSEELPHIMAYETEIRQVFQNLIANAIKFVGPDTLPKINISSTTLPGKIQFSVSDNGIGIEEKYFERIFAVFRRLHSKSEYPGTGIGLAHCKKVVEMHGGEIWIDSEIGKGSTFHFSISTTLQ